MSHVKGPDLSRLFTFGVRAGYSERQTQAGFGALGKPGNAKNPFNFAGRDGTILDCFMPVRGFLRAGGVTEAPCRRTYSGQVSLPFPRFFDGVTPPWGNDPERCRESGRSRPCCWPEHGEARVFVTKRGRRTRGGFPCLFATRSSDWRLR